MLKRLSDIVLSLVVLLFVSPIFLILFILIKSKLGSPVLFYQIRPGLNGKPFQMIKFRTMTDCKDSIGNLLSDAERLTPFGKFLRSTSLDELPELWNVLKGEMSLVGPRPLLMEYLPLYNEEQKRRHEVKPGITGWAQVNGRNTISWEDKFKLDVWYVDNRSFLLDLKILFLTIKKVLIKEGISASGEATASKFTGNKLPLLAILGASGHGKVIADTAELLGFECVFFDDAWPEKKKNGPWEIVGNTEELLTRRNEFRGVVVGIGNNKTRLEKIKLLKEKDIALPAIIHPQAVISSHATIEYGSVVFSNVVVNADVQIGTGCILNTGCSIDHDCVLDPGVHISPGARLAGNVKVGSSSWIGIGAVVRQGITIGVNCIVGAGAAVVKNIPDTSTVVGVPAKNIS